MKKSSVAILSALTIIPLTALLLLTILPMTLTGCFFNTHHARFDSPYYRKFDSYLDLDYIESLEIFGTTQKGDVYLVDDESVFEKALPGYDSTVDFDKQIAVLCVYDSSNPKYYVHSIRLNDGVLTVGVFHTSYYISYALTIQPSPRVFVLIIDKISFDSVDFVDVRSGRHPH